VTFLMSLGAASTPFTPGHLRPSASSFLAPANADE
jgi:hypothetical protein